MRDVAALAGVSFKTVSRVVNNEPGVSESLREKVERAALQLDYRHNFAASALRRNDGRTGVVGALLQDVANSFSASVLRSLEDVARERGVVVLAASLDEEADRERSLVADLATRRVDGLVLMPSTDRQDYLLAEHRAGLPVVFVDRSPRGIDADSVRVDNFAGAVIATKHLVANGHSRIAVLSDLLSIETASERVSGFKSAMKAAGLKLDPQLTATSLRSAQAAEKCVAELVRASSPPTAIFACRNDISIGAIRALRAAGLSDRIALVGFDDFPMADLVAPALTVIRQNVSVIGSEVGRMLFERIDGESGAPRHVVLMPTLVARGSGEIPPAS